jgi:hypothetical protein
MSLIKIGSFSDFSISPKESILKTAPQLANINSFAEFSETSIETPINAFDYSVSNEARGIGLKRIHLDQGFGSFLGRLFDTTKDLYFVAWSWDLSGQPINLYPWSGVQSTDVLIKLKAGRVRDFIGTGINLFPKKNIKGGISIRIQLWESNQDLRNFGKAMVDTANSIDKSELNNLLLGISALTGVSGATLSLIEKASIELTKVIGTILKTDGDDYVDYFEGYYPVDLVWNIGDETYSGNSSEITLEKY